MKDIEAKKSLILGLSVGILGTLIVWGFTESFWIPRGEEIVAEIGSEKLTRTALRSQIANELVPVENDEYRILNKASEEWVDSRLLEREAKSQGIPLDELYQKEVWSRVQVSYQDTVEFYNKNRELFDQPFEKMSALISQELRRREYARSKDQFIGQLREKYDARIQLKKPESYVEGLALPYVFPGPGAELAIPAKAPSPASLEPPQPSGPLPSAGPIFTDLEGRPSQGSKDAPITLVEFSDFHCPFCARVTPTMNQLMQNYPGKIYRVWRHFPLPMHAGADKTHEASECAAEQGKFWEYHDKLFETLGSPKDEQSLINLAKQLGLNEGQFQQCLTSGKYRDLIQQEIAKGNQVGVDGTPTVFVNGQPVAGAYPYEYFVNIIEGILNPGRVPPAQAAQPGPPSPPGPPPVATFDDLEGRPSLGPRDAAVTIVEFSDFHCPFCARATPTMDQLMINFQGKIRRVWRHFPLAMHPGAERTHEASECASEQNKFWEYHHKLFEKPGGFRDEEAFIELAKQTGLNEKKFKQCLESGKYRDVIQQDLAKGNQVGVRGTPAFFVNGQLVSGAQPYENFERIIQSELSKAGP